MREPLLVLGLCFAVPAAAAEGMWTFNRPPVAQMQTALKWKPDQKWLDHVRLASVRFNSGGSGSFVSTNGLVLTNHHVGADCIHKLGKKDANLIEDGFLAATDKDEVRCPDLELNVLMEIREVTAEVKGVEKPGMAPAEINTAQKAKMTELEQACAKETGDRCDVVTLYQGGMYDLYRYHKYTDVRLVFAPEGQIAFFGGDTDNFTFPRFDYDMALFRAYEDGKPFRTPHHLAWPKSALREGDVTVTSGHPGNTSRLLTVAQLETLRDFNLHLRHEDLRRVEAVLKGYAAQGIEFERQAHTPLFSVQNGLKAIGGYLAGLRDDALLNRKRQEEAKLPSQEQVAAISAAQTAFRPYLVRWYETENNTFGSKLYGMAKTLLRLVEEKQKPSDKRLREYRDSNLASVELALYSPAPIYPELEVALLTSGLQDFAARLGDKDPLVVRALAGKTAAARARELIENCRLLDPEVRKGLAALDPQALAQKAVPMLELARLIDPEARTLRKRFEDEVEGPVKQAQAALQALRNQTGGLSSYPDATFTLRLSYGTLSGYTENGAKVAAWTTSGGLFDRADQARKQTPDSHEWDLPKKWAAARAKLRPSTPFNLATTNDIIGGNSGSPVVNQKGEIVGLIFDGNIQSLVGNFVYDPAMNRAISVAAPALLEGLEVVYGAHRLVKELRQK